MKELMELIGKHGHLNTDGIKVLVRVLNVKQAYGRTRYVVEPIAGYGEVTVEDFRVTVLDEATV